MNIDFFKVLTSRRSIRMYRATPVDEGDLFLLVEMALKAPSAGNLQDYRFIVCTDKKMIYKLPEMCMDQMWMSSAPAVIVVCSQPQEQAKWFGERGRHVFSTQNASAATQNILLSAHALGLGACWVGGFNQEQIDALFGVTGKARVESIITIGYPAEKPQPKEEINISTGMYFNTFGNKKFDKDARNKDYSIKLERFMDEKKHQVQDISAKGKAWLKQVKEKIKGSNDEYKDVLGQQK